MYSFRAQVNICLNLIIMSLNFKHKLEYLLTMSNAIYSELLIENFQEEYVLDL